MIGIITDGAFLIAGNWARVRRVSLFCPGDMKESLCGDGFSSLHLSFRVKCYHV